MNPAEELAADWVYRHDEADWAMSLALINEALEMAALGQPLAVARTIRAMKAKEKGKRHDR